MPGRRDWSWNVTSEGVPLIPAGVAEAASLEKELSGKTKKRKR